MLQQYLISIDARLRLRNSTVSVKAETAECLVARDSIIAWCLYKRIETFHVHFWIIQIYVCCIKHAYKFLLRKQVELRPFFDACVNVFLVLSCLTAKIFILKNCQPPPSINRTSPNEKRDQFQPFPNSTDCHTKHIAMFHGLWPSDE